MKRGRERSHRDRNVPLLAIHSTDLATPRLVHLHSASPHLITHSPHETIVLEMLQYVYNLLDLRTMHVAIDIFCILIFAPQWAFSTIHSYFTYASRTRTKTRKRITDNARLRYGYRYKGITPDM